MSLEVTLPRTPFTSFELSSFTEEEEDAADDEEDDEMKVCYSS